ncbi:beta-ketoacyl synthase N-terminal-like domain-containing protein [Kitasatospora sp. NPDC056327]|uniref:beta-ketoacyl synthase N-terminal-like domain-containing protein n=1 Tax=Kitasatospora sp. NPDC056327 TaxID=3345785 RepID=UPI0035DEB59B
MSTGRTAPAVHISGLGTALPGVPGPHALLDAPRHEPRDPAAALRGGGLRYKDRATRLALAAALAALADARLLDDEGNLTVDGEDFGVVVSTNWGNVDTVCDTSATIRRHSYRATSPMLLPNTASNVTASWLAITHGLRGANLTLNNGPTSGLDAVHFARTLIAAGRLRRALVVGVEPANDPVRRLLDGSPGPGALLDGAAALVAEAADAVRERAVTPLARIGRYARAGDLAAATAAARRGESAPPGTWWTPEPPLAGPAPGPVTAGTAHALHALHGRCSGALGVLQCVAATAGLARDHGESALAATGHGPLDTGAGQDDAAAALWLHRIPGARPGAAP